MRQPKPLHFTGNSLPKGCETKLQLVEKKVTSDPNRLLKRNYIIRNVAGEEKDKNYVLEEIEAFLSNCSKQGGKRNYSDVEATLVTNVDIPLQRQCGTLETVNTKQEIGTFEKKHLSHSKIFLIFIRDALKVRY